jgi:hypothetical protein
LWSWWFSTCNSCNRYPFTWRCWCRMCQTLEWCICKSRLTRCVDFWGLLTKVSCTCSTVSADGPSPPVHFTAHRQPLCWNFLYHSWIVVHRWFCVALGPKPPLHHHNWFSFGKFKDTECFLSPVLTMFRQDCPLVVKSTSMPWCLLPKQTWRDSWPTDILLSAVSILVVVLPSSHSCYITCLSHPPWLGHYNHTWWKVQVIKLHYNITKKRKNQNIHT